MRKLIITTTLLLIALNSSGVEGVILNSIQDSPDPFSPSESQLQIVSSWTISNVGPNVNNSSVEIYTVLRVKTTILGPANTAIREFTSQISVSDSSATGTIQKTVEQTWNGKDSSGAVVPSGQYTYTVVGSIIKIQHNKAASANGERTKETVQAIATGSGTVVVGSVAPTVSEFTPPNATFVRNPRPKISAKFGDAPAGINLSTLEVYIDGVLVNVTADATGFSYVPPDNLADGKHSVVVKVLDNAGNPATVKE